MVKIDDINIVVGISEMRLMYVGSFFLSVFPVSAFAQCVPIHDGDCSGGVPWFIALPVVVTGLYLLLSTWRTTIASVSAALALGYLISFVSVGLGISIGIISWFFFNQYFEYLSATDDQRSDDK